VNKYDREVLDRMREMDRRFEVAEPPRWLKAARWRPTFCLRIRRDRRIVAVDVIPSGLIPQNIYRQQVTGLLAAHDEFRVIVCMLEEGYAQHPDMGSFCASLGVGLKVLDLEVGLETICRIDVDPQVSRAPLPADKGWFPEAILSLACRSTRLAFGGEVATFAGKLAEADGDQQEAFSLVRQATDKLLQGRECFGGNIQQFMRLAHFERLLRLTSAVGHEHVLHSFRVFLAGCPIVNMFYDNLRRAQQRFCVGERRDARAEYCWLLASLFHDVGRTKQGVRELAAAAVEDDDIEVNVIGKESRWSKPEYQNALRALSSLAAHVASGASSGSWDGGSIPDSRGEEIAADWRNTYDKMESHGVIGAIDFLAKAFGAATAADERANRPFILTHAVPAALAILLHDWRVWRKAREWGLVPIDVSVLPLAAVLIYLDTWDDYKRGGPEPSISIREYVVDSKGARVTIEWGDSDALEREKAKYEAFESVLQNPFCALKINAKLGSNT